MRGGNTPRQSKSNRELLNEVKRLQEASLKIDSISRESQAKTDLVLWRGQTGLQTLYFEYQCGLWQIQEFRTAGEFNITLAIGVLALGIAANFWPIHLISASLFGLSYYFLYRAHVETRNWDIQMTARIKQVIDSIDKTP